MIFQFTIKSLEDDIIGFEKEIFDILTRTILYENLIVYEIHFCLHESIMNIIKHTYKWDQTRNLDIRIDINNEIDENSTTVEIIIKDYGPPVKAVINPPGKVRNFQLRKRGLYMISKIMDKFYIEPLEKTGNKTYMRKKIIKPGVKTWNQD